MNIKKNIQQSTSEVLNQLGITLQQDHVVLEHPADTTNGDFSANIAMTLFGKLKKKQGNDFDFSSPRELAQAISDKLNDKKIDGISDISIAGPGFINFTLSDSFLLSKMGLIIKKGGDTLEKHGNGKKVVAEYSSPNIAKPFTVGHLRSTIIGDSLANILEASDYEVYRDNHLGDWGTQFGKQIHAIKTWGDEEVIENSDNPVKELVKLYVKFHQEVEKDPSIEDMGRQWFTKLENGDTEARRLWEKCINWSWKEFDKIYKLLNVSFTENGGRGYGESFFENKMDSVIAELNEKNLLQESKGAQLVFFPEDKYPPLMILKNDGSTLYSTRDLATDKFRIEKYGKDITIFNEVGAEQSLYFQQIYEIEQMLGWYKPEQRVHVGHGLISFKDKKMSTRKGNVVWLDDVLNESYKRVNAISKDLSEDSIWKIAVGALKWNDLKRKMHLQMMFDWDEITNIKGNSGPYMQYTYVRCLSVLKKAQDEVFETLLFNKNVENNTDLIDSNVIKNQDTLSNITNHFDILLNSKEHLSFELNMNEKDILRNLYKYSDIVKLSAIEYAPHHIANYLYLLAQSFNTFYSNNKIISFDDSNNLENIEQTKLRLLIVSAVAHTIKHGLNLLGIQTIEKM
jgi:arginyl-tRNA synthetase